jgi:hypothetical protein
MTQRAPHLADRSAVLPQLLTEYEVSENVTQQMVAVDIEYVEEGKHYLRSTAHSRIRVRGDLSPVAKAS